MRDGANIRFGENCADVLADLHQGRLEQLTMMIMTMMMVVVVVVLMMTKVSSDSWRC